MLNLLFPVVNLVSFNLPSPTWFGRLNKPVIREVSVVRSLKCGRQFSSLQEMYWFIIDTKEGEVFQYYHNKWGVYMYID